MLGKNGTGKTTLIRILSTLILPDSGEVIVCGLNAVKECREVRRRVGVMLNAGEGGFHPRLSGFSNLEYFAALYNIPLREARTRIKGMMSLLGLEDRGTDQYQTYSSGMKRRLALARAMLPDSPVLLLDEPTIGIDPWSTEQIHNHLHDLSKQGKTILCTTNSRAEANALGDHAYLLEKGSISRQELGEITGA